MKIQYLAMIVLFSVGKIIAATGQTLFSTHHALHYIFSNLSTSAFFNIISFVTASCTLCVIVITRIPAIYKQFQWRLKQRVVAAHLYDDSIYQTLSYNLLVFCNITAGIFSSVGAYLGTITIVEFIASFYHNDITANGIVPYTQICAIFIACASFASYYSFNIQKAKINSIKIINHCNPINTFKINKVFIKTFMMSFLNIVSVPFIAYFLTKSALYKMPYLSGILPAASIKCIATFSAMTALIASLTTTVTAMYDYFSEIDNITFNHKDSGSWRLLRYITYGTGLVDSSANGLGNFLGIITISHDVLNTELNNRYVVMIAIGSGISATLLNLAFSIRQGFNDLAHPIQEKRYSITNDYAHSGSKVMVPTNL